jgi:hypothetical protein
VCAFFLALIGVLPRLLFNKQVMVLFSGFMMAWAGFHCALGAGTYFWAKRKEREGQGPVMIRFPTSRNSQ